MSQSDHTPMELAFWEYAELYTGMQGVDMEKSSHGRAFIAGWESAMKHLDYLCEPGLIKKLVEK